MKNYYEILELSPKASSEVIERTYKVLAKKYHPDLQPEDKKKAAEEKFKEISEAYEVLSNSEKKFDYDIAFNKEQEALKENLQHQLQNNSSYADNSSNYNNQTNNTNIYNNKTNPSQNEQISKENLDFIARKAYADAYNNTLRSFGFKLKHKRTFKDYMSILITILVLIIIGAILWFIPWTNKIIVDIYNSNPVFRTIFDIIGNVIGGIGKGIWTFICSIFGIK